MGVSGRDGCLAGFMARCEFIELAGESGLEVRDGGLLLLVGVLGMLLMFGGDVGVGGVDEDCFFGDTG
jgi:hypothetical protein